MHMSKQVVAMTRASKMRVATTMPLQLLAAALIAVVPYASALAQSVPIPPSRFVSIIKAANGSFTEGAYDCTTDVCSLPSSGPSAIIAFPNIAATATFDVTNGVLRGRTRLEANVESHGSAPHSVLLRGITSFQTMVHVTSVMGSQTVEVGGIGSTRIDASLHNSTSAGASCPSNECDHQNVSQSVVIRMTRGTGEIADEHESFNTLSAGRLGSPPGEQENLEPVSLQMPFEETFGLSWEFETEVELNMNNNIGQFYAENDFTGTLGFTSLRFYDAEGNDVSSMVNVTFDRPLDFLSVAAPVPEPETYAMLLAGLGLLGVAARRRKQKEAALA